MSDALVSIQRAILDIRAQIAELRGDLGKASSDPEAIAAMVKGNIDSMANRLDEAVAAMVAAQNAQAIRIESLEGGLLQLEDKMKNYFIKDRYAITRSTLIDIINSEAEIKERLRNG